MPFKISVDFDNYVHSDYKLVKVTVDIAGLYYVGIFDSFVSPGYIRIADSFVLDSNNNLRDFAKLGFLSFIAVENLEETNPLYQQYREALFPIPSKKLDFYNPFKQEKQAAEATAEADAEVVVEAIRKAVAAVVAEAEVEDEDADDNATQ
jgi:hypothetical protein